MNEPRSLQELLDAAASRHGLSMRQLALKARSAGYSVVDTTLNAIRNGTYKSQPREETVRAIGWLAGVSDEVAFTAAGLRVPGPPFADELPPGVDNLSPRKRKAVIELLRVLIDDEEAMGNAEHPAPTSTTHHATGSGKTQTFATAGEEVTTGGGAEPGVDGRSGDAAPPGRGRSDANPGQLPVVPLREKRSRGKSGSKGTGGHRTGQR